MEIDKLSLSPFTFSLLHLSSSISFLCVSLFPCIPTTFPSFPSKDEWNIPEVTLRAVPSDRQLSRLASRLGSEWESVLLDLGLSTGELYRCRADHPLSLHGQVLAGLIQWRQSQGRSATVRRLLQSLQSTDVHPSTLDEVFQ